MCCCDWGFDHVCSHSRARKGSRMSELWWGPWMHGLEPRWRLQICRSRCEDAQCGVETELHRIYPRLNKCVDNHKCQRSMYLFDLSGAPFFRIRCLKSGPKLTCFVHFYFKMRFSPQRRAIFGASELQKVLRNCRVLYIFTSKCAFRHMRGRLVRVFFNIRTYKSGPKHVHSMFLYIFRPQRRAIFSHQMFEKWSETGRVLYIFTSKCGFSPRAACNFGASELQKVPPKLAVFLYIFTSKWCLSPQRRCIFSTSELTKVVQTRHVLYILTCKCASRHSRVPFLNIRNFQNKSEIVVFCAFWLANVLFATAACNFWFLLWAATSAPAALKQAYFSTDPDTRIIEKTQHFATSLTFRAHVSSFF